MPTRRTRGKGSGGHARTGRLAETIREVVAEELERLGDDELELVTVTSVDVSNDLAGAVVYYSALLAGADDGGAVVAAALDELRWPIQQRINRVVSARRTPQIEFRPDDVLDGALRIDELLRDDRGPDRRSVDPD